MRASLPAGRRRSFVITDDFNRADQTPIGNSTEGWGWTDLDGTNFFSILSNRVTVNGSTSGPVSLRADVDLGSADTYSQVTIASSTTASDRAGVSIRHDPATQARYQFSQPKNNANGIWAKIANGGSSTTLATVPLPVWTAGDVWRIEAQGTTLRLYQNGVLASSITDGTLSGQYAGITIGSNGPNRIRYDNFSAGRL